MTVSLPNAHLKHLKQSDTSNTPRYLKRLSNAIMLQPSNDNDKITFFEWDVKKNRINQSYYYLSDKCNVILLNLKTCKAIEQYLNIKSEIIHRRDF